MDIKVTLTSDDMPIIRRLMSELGVGTPEEALLGLLRRYAASRRISKTPRILKIRSITPTIGNISEITGIPWGKAPTAIEEPDDL